MRTIALLFGCALLAVTLFAVFWRPEVVVRPPEQSFDISRDPKSGAVVPLPKADMYGRAIERQHGKQLIIYAGGCVGCSKTAVDFTRLPYDHYEQVVVFYEAPEKDISKLVAARYKSYPQLRVVSDANGELASSLNALWLGRWYVVDSGRFVRAQREVSDGSYAD